MMKKTVLFCALAIATLCITIEAMNTPLLNGNNNTPLAPLTKRTKVEHPEFEVEMQGRLFHDDPEEEANIDYPEEWEENFTPTTEHLNQYENEFNEAYDKENNEV